MGGVWGIPAQTVSPPLQSLVITAPQQDSDGRLDLIATNELLKRSSGLRNLLVTRYRELDQVDIYIRLEVLKKHAATLKYLYLDIFNSGDDASVRAPRDLVIELPSLERLEQVALNMNIRSDVAASKPPLVSKSSYS